MSSKKMSWEQRIAQAKARGRFTPLDHQDAHQSWLSCAIGEKSAHEGFDANRVVYGAGFESDFRDGDQQLRSLGVAFGTAVADDEVKVAQRLWDRIGKRWEVFMRRVERRKLRKFYAPQRRWNEDY